MCVKMQYVYRNKYNGNKKREAEELVVRGIPAFGTIVLSSPFSVPIYKNLASGFNFFISLIKARAG
jgi:hypothetical protein